MTSKLVGKWELESSEGIYLLIFSNLYHLSIVMINFKALMTF
jgi:hypothetical protein